jgi:hypothetical protein
MKTPIPDDVAEKTISDLLKRAKELLEQKIKENFLLSSWKEIGNFFGLREVHTMQRWAKVYRMPYMRIGGRVSIPVLTAMQWYWELWELVHKEGGSDRFTQQLIQNLSHVTSRKKKV